MFMKKSILINLEEKTAHHKILNLLIMNWQKVKESFIQSLKTLFMKTLNSLTRKCQLQRFLTLYLQFNQNFCKFQNIKNWVLNLQRWTKKISNLSILISMPAISMDLYRISQKSLRLLAVHQMKLLYTDFGLWFIKIKRLWFANCVHLKMNMVIRNV